jgi:hypothetical protein
MKKILIVLLLLLSVPVYAETNVFQRLPEKKLLALMIYGEARSNSFEGKVAVASVAMERVDYVESIIGKENGILRKVLLKPKQFSCFNETDTQYDELFYIAYNWNYEIKINDSLRQCYGIAKGIINKQIQRHPVVVQYKIKNYMTSETIKDWEKGMRIVLVLDGHKFLVKINDYWKGYKNKLNRKDV